MEKNVSSIKNVLINSGLYSVTSILQKAIGFFMLPLYTIYLTPRDYGITGLIASLSSVLILLFTFSLNSAINRYYFKYKENEEKLRDFWGTIITFIIMNSIILGTLIIFLRKWVLMPFVKDIEFYPYVFISIMIVIVSPIYTIYLSILQTLQEAKNYGINSTINFIFVLVMNIILIVWFKMGAVGQLLSSLIAGIIFAFYSIYILLKKKLIRFTICKVYLKEALKYSIPLLPHLMSGTIAVLVSRIFLNNSTSTDVLGLFNVASQFLIIVDTIQAAVNNAYIPWFYDLMSRGRSEHKRVIDFADFMLRLNCVFSLMMSFFIKEILIIMTSPSYLSAWRVIPFMLIAYQVRGIYLFYVNTLFYNTKATKFIFIATLSGNIISIILSALLTEKLGIMAPAIILICEKVITTSIVIILSKKIEPISFNLGKMTIYVFILIISSTLGLYFDYINPYENIVVFNVVYKIGILIVISFILMKSDLKKMNTYVKAKLKNH